MIYTADYLIQKRKEKWEQFHSIEKDKELRDAIAEEIIANDSLKKEIIKYPEKLIELEFVVVDKEQNTIPFFLNGVQRDFINIMNDNKDKFSKGEVLDLSFLVLKGRQQGFTTLITAYQLACSITNKNFQGFTLSDKSENTEAIFQNKAKFTYSHLPAALKPTEKFNNKRQLLFEKINSSWSVDTATDNVGRSKTINFFHGSECAFWNCGISSIQAGLGEAFTRNCIKIYESTANGYNDYETMWSSGTYINCFFEWWKTKEYSLDFESEKIKQRFIYDIDNNNIWIFTRLKYLRDEKGLSLGQLYWYYRKYLSYIDKELIKQEYPCSPEEAFLMSGRLVFDSEKIIARINKLKEPVAIGFFTYDEEKAKENIITDIKWVHDPNGCIRIYETVKEGHPYVIGGDTSGDGSDYNVGWALDNSNSKNVAVLRKQLDETEYTRQCYCLGMYYNQALIGIEINFSTYPTKKLKEYNYPNLYRRQIEDNIAEDTVDKYGFRTDRLTRPIIIQGLIQVFKDYIDTINDLETLKEALKFVYNDKMKPEAQVGSHDDLIMSSAIAHYIRTQQRYEVIKKVKVKEVKLPFELIDNETKKDEYVGW